MANKYLEHDLLGGMREKEATISGGSAGEAGDIVGLDGTGRISQTMMPVGVAADTATITASEDLSAGDWVNVYDNGGEANVRKADAAQIGRDATGFVLQAVIIVSDANAEVYFEGQNNQVTGMTAGSPVYLSDGSPGGGTHTAPIASGSSVQKTGRAISITSVAFEPTNSILLV